MGVYYNLFGREEGGGYWVKVKYVFWGVNSRQNKEFGGKLLSLGENQFFFRLILKKCCNFCGAWRKVGLSHGHQAE